MIYFNGEKIKFRGVNRHDSDPKTGAAIDVDKIKNDLTLMKKHNFNAIRCSHYPNAPYFYQMCERYGFLVIDEADIEAHGPFMLYREKGEYFMQLKYVETKEEIIAVNKKSKHIEPHLHNALEIVCVTSGTLELGVGQELYRMEKGDIGFVFPDIIHHYHCVCTLHRKTESGREESCGE